MKPQNQAVLDEIMREVRTYTITQRRVLLRAMRNPRFATISSCLAVADERDSGIAAQFIRGLHNVKHDTIPGATNTVPRHHIKAPATNQDPSGQTKSPTTNHIKAHRRGA